MKTLLTLCVLCMTAYADTSAKLCYDGSCQKVSAGPQPPSGSRLHQSHDGSRWYVNDLDNRHWFIYSPHLGVFDRKTRLYAQYNGKDGFLDWKPREALPAELPYGALTPWKEPDTDTKPFTVELPTGVDADKIDINTKYRANGKEISKAKAYELIENAVPDLSNKRRITLIGSIADCKKAIELLPKDFNEWSVVKTFLPTDWYVKENGFVTGGSPVVYCQAPDGTVIHRQNDTTDLKEAYDRMNPKYDPSTDPDLRINQWGPAKSWYGYGILAGIFVAGGLTFRFGPTVYSAIYNTWHAARIQRETDIMNSQALQKQQMEMLQAQLAAQLDAQKARDANMEQLTKGLTVLANQIPNPSPKRTPVAPPVKPPDTEE